MRASQFLIATLKETPADAEVISHQLMLRAGMIRKLASGLYTWLPLGLRILRKVETIVREEMNRAGAQEVLMPVVQPAELWTETGRWQQYGAELLRIQDRHQRDFCLGPTHEEVITELVRNEISSYKQLPINLYQIQTKFRDEIRPRFGVMRAREFIMKDAYSFHLDAESLQETYEVMYQAYSRIFERIQLDFRAVLADTGSIGGSCSHEFHVLADSGEDAIAFSTDSDYAANVELAEAMTQDTRPSPSQTLATVATLNQHSIQEVAAFLNIEPTCVVKTLIVLGNTPQVPKVNDTAQQHSAIPQTQVASPLIALVLRGDHTLNTLKAEKLPGIAKPLRFASEAMIQEHLHCQVGSIGPVDLPVLTTYVDRSAAVISDFVCGANKDGHHHTGVNWDRDVACGEVVDIREIESGDVSPCGQGSVEIKRGIEVGHIFQLGQKYSEAMSACVLNEQGKSQTLLMGCYGIGVSRVIAAAIEQNHDNRGIVWPTAIAPFQIALVPINPHKSPMVAEFCEALYTQLSNLGYDVLYMDEPKVRLGVMLADTDLMGIPHRLVVGEKGLNQGTVEYKARHETESRDIEKNDLFTFLRQSLAQHPE